MKISEYLSPPAPAAIYTGDDTCCGDALASSGSAMNATGIWPAANRAIFVPFTIMSAITVRRFIWANGGVVAGNVDCGVYNNAGGLIDSLGSTTMAGATGTQAANLAADRVLLPGYYYLAMASDSATATFFRGTPLAQVCASLGIRQMDTAFPLPATAVFAVITTATVPRLTLGKIVS